MDKYGIHVEINTCGYMSVKGVKGLVQEGAESASIIFFTNKHLTYSKLLTESEFIDMCVHNKGVGILNTNEKIIICNDPFCSVPVYVAKEGDKIVISSDIEMFYGNGRKTDRMGFYEILLYGSALYDRTLIEGVKQFPAASMCIIDKSSMDFLIKPYWNFEVKENPLYENINKAVEDVKNCLFDIFRGINIPITMGISGGLDSRLSACMLYETKKSEELSFFTFGYDPRIKENTISKDVLRELWDKDLPKHSFVKLTASDYQNSRYVPESTGGQIGLNHIHQYACVRRMKNKPNTLISNYYSDAVMGWDAIPVRSNETMEESDYYRHLQRNTLGLTDEEISLIEQDLKKVCDRYPKSGNFSCMNEFIYVTERNPKFHVRLTAVLAEFVNVELPYADYELLSLMLSVPINNRAEKLIEEKITQQYLGEMHDISSRRYFERSENSEKRYSLTKRLYYSLGYYRMRGTNAFNAMMAKLTDYRIQVINPYQTENQNQVLNQSLYEEFLEGLSYLREQGLVNDKMVALLNKKDYRSKNIGMKFNMIGLWKCVERL